MRTLTVVVGCCFTASALAFGLPAESAEGAIDGSEGNNILVEEEPTHSGSGSVIWIRRLATPSGDFVTGVATDSDGNVAVSGWTGGSLGGPNRGGSDAFLGKYAAEGKLLWVRQIGTSASDSARGVASDGLGNIVIVGETYGSLGGAQQGENDAFIVKYSPQGKRLWKRQLGTPGQDSAQGVATDKDNNILIGGYTSGSLGQPLGGVDAFVAKYSADGQLLWKRQLGTPATDYGGGVATDKDGNAVISGWTDGSLAGSNKGGIDAFTAQLNPDGALLWKRQLGTTEEDLSVGRTTDRVGSVFIGGQTYGALAGPSQGQGDAFVAKYSVYGRLLWKRQLGTAGEDFAYPLATDTAGNIVLGGGTTGDLAGPNQGSYDGFIAKYSAIGRLLWKRQIGTTGTDLIYGAATDANDNIFVGGDVVSPSTGDFDVFVAKLRP